MASVNRSGLFSNVEFERFVLPYLVKTIFESVDVGSVYDVFWQVIPKSRRAIIKLIGLNTSRSILRFSFVKLEVMFPTAATARLKGARYDSLVIVMEVFIYLYHVTSFPAVYKGR